MKKVVITVLDVENTTCKRDGKQHFDPFEAENELVMIGMLSEDMEYYADETVVTFTHSDEPPTANGEIITQNILDATTLLVCHNAVHDLTWIWECGFKYDGNVYDTMLGEYILNKGVKSPLNLGFVSAQYQLEEQKLDTMSDYWKSGTSTKDIPFDELDEYLRYDLRSTLGVYKKQMARFANEENSSMLSVLDLTMDTCYELALIYKRGFKVDMVELNKVKTEFEEERAALSEELMAFVEELMGDTPFNINSPEQLSALVFSRKPNDKKMWALSVNAFMSDSAFKDAMRSMTGPVYKTKASKCFMCSGTGMVQLLTKKGTPRKNKNICKECNRQGFTLKNTKELAGLKFTPPKATWASASGFSTGKGILETLEVTARAKGMEREGNFLSKLRRLNAIESYLSSFVGGIEKYTKADGMLHVQLTQHITSTARLSGRNPNMQNMPRGGTFPVKRVFISRWKGGKIMEADFGQLEFRVAAYLSQDKVAIKEVIEGFDVHQYTADIITNAGQDIGRQNAKMHTFAPLYGASGYGRTPAEAEYYTHFMHKYRGICDWHKRLATEALSERKITTPSGRQFAFPDVSRRRDGTVTNFTMIKNYPVQSFATADIVPVALLMMEETMKERGLISCIVNTVHDSMVIDVHPDEQAAMIAVVVEVESKLVSTVNTLWDIDFNLPLTLEAKMGNNWLDQVDC